MSPLSHFFWGNLSQFSKKPNKTLFPFHAQREGRRAGVDSAACTATAEKTAKTRF